jgi:hypothetical protein
MNRTTLLLVDRSGMDVGTIIISSEEEGMILGDFQPGPGFARYADLFRAHEQSANDMLLVEVDRLEEAIRSPGFSVARTDKPGAKLPISDLQIMGVGISFRWAG